MSIHPNLSDRFKASPRAVAQVYVAERENPARSALYAVADWLELILAAAMAIGIVVGLMWAADGVDFASLFN